MLNRIFRRHSSTRPQEHHISEIIPVLCKFWQEDGVWNGSGVDIPVAAFGDTIEEAKKNLLDAIICHLEALQEVNQLQQEIKRLQLLAQDCRLSVEQMSDDKLYGKATAKISDHKLAVAMSG